MSEEVTNTTSSLVDSTPGTSGLQQKNDQERHRQVVSTPFPNPYLPPNTIYYDSSTIRCQPVSVPIPTPYDFKITLNVKDIKLDTLRISIVRHVLMINGEKMKRSHGLVFSVLWSKQFPIPYDTDVYNFTAWVSFEKFLTVYAPKLNPIINVAVHVANSSSEPRKKKIRTVPDALEGKGKCEFINVETQVDHIHVFSEAPVKKQSNERNDQPGPSSASDKPADKPGPSKKHAKFIPKKSGKKIQPVVTKQGGIQLEQLLKKERRKSE